MTDRQILFSRPFPVAELSGEPTLLSIAATTAECDVLAVDLGLSALSDFAIDFQIIKRPGDHVLVEGELRARMTQICVVTLDPFETSLVAPIRVEFASPEAVAAAVAARPPREPRPGDPPEDQPDPPDPIIAGRVDLGLVATEFLALSLDPYPRKPGVAFSAPPAAEEPDESPFAALARLKRDEN